MKTNQCKGVSSAYPTLKAAIPTTATSIMDFGFIPPLYSRRKATLFNVLFDAAFNANDWSEINCGY
jgi:hypothetical protein